ncbi:MAG: hypothetical protein JWP37_2915 [Mucilaginibacter sp.]|nr:hypothetical protein [Mucilaginibacter sp.]
MLSYIKTVDIETFALLKDQTIEVCTFLLVTRDFASGKGMQKNVNQIDSALAENNRMLRLVNNQLYDLNKTNSVNRIGFFDTI